MTQNKCAIVPKHLKCEQRIKSAFVESKQYACQFSDILIAEYEYDKEYFCILHLPHQIKQKQKLLGKAEQILNEQINKGATNFNFISSDSLKIHKNIKASNLSFMGAWLWSVRLDGIKEIQNIDFSYAEIQGVNIINNCAFERIIIRNADISSYFELNSVNATYFIAQHSDFHPDANFLRLDYYNYGLIIKDSNVKNFHFNYNDCKLTISFSDCEIERLNLENSIFYLCPMISKSQFKNLNELVLPTKKNFIFKKIRSLCKLSDKKAKNSIWMEQYRRLREIYNLAKNRDMYLEQSDYFYLMQNCFEKNSDAPTLLRAFSWLYNVTSHYGQSLLRPIIGIKFTLLICKRFGKYIFLILIFSSNLWLFKSKKGAIHGSKQTRVATRKVGRAY